MNAAIVSAVAAENHILWIALDNGNELSLDVKPLLKYARFAPLRDSKMWVSLTKRQDCLIWNNGDVTVELGLDELLDYFA